MLGLHRGLAIGAQCLFCDCVVCQTDRLLIIPLVPELSMSCWLLPAVTLLPL